MSKKGRPEKQLARGTLGGEIRYLRSVVRGITTEQLGQCLGVRNQQISYAEQALEQIDTGKFTRRERHEKNEHKGYSDQLVFAIAQELGSDFGEPVIREHLAAWFMRVQQNWHLKPIKPSEQEPPTSLASILLPDSGDAHLMSQVPDLPAPLRQLLLDLVKLLKEWDSLNLPEKVKRFDEWVKSFRNETGLPKPAFTGRTRFRVREEHSEATRTKK